MTRCITSIGQGEPAMMPVRSDAEVEAPRTRGWSSSAMNIVGTPCSAVQRSAATASRTARGVEALARKHHRRAVREAGEVAEHHAEAVVQRHRNAEPVALGQPHRLADEVAVVDDVVVRERRAFGRARSCRS